MRSFSGKHSIVPPPDITHVFYRRDAGYTIERITLSKEFEAILRTIVGAGLMPWRLSERGTMVSPRMSG
jgi:hypothetical protein